MDGQRTNEAALAMNTAFRPHGKFTTHVEGRLIVSEVTGPWNKELVEYWGARCHADAKLLGATGPWVGIAVIRESMLCPPSAIDSLRRIAHYSGAKLNCIAHVIVADASVDGRNFLEPAFARIYEGAVEHAIFDTVDEARAWSLALLRSKGF
jgi:hypothetical protein